MILLYAALFLLSLQQEPTPTTVIEPVTQPVLHCPAGWHVEVWHKGYDPNSGGGWSTAPLFIKQGYPAAYGPYSAPLVIFSGDAATDKDHPAKCVLDASLVKEVPSLVKEVPSIEKLPTVGWDTTDGTLTTSTNTNILFTSDKCNWTGFTYDAKINVCYNIISFSPMEPVTCKKLHRNMLRCYYKPSKLPALNDDSEYEYHHFRTDPCDGLACTGPVEMLPKPVKR